MIDPELQHKLNMSVQELDLSVRANNCLESAKISSVRELVKKTDGDLLKVRFDTLHEAIAPGQLVALFDPAGDEVLGAATIREVL